MADWFSAAAAVAALVISLVALWRSNLASFHPLVVSADLHFCVFPIRSGSERWFLPSATTSVSIANQGARGGAITNMRMRITFPGTTSPGEFIVLRPCFELDPAGTATIGRDRFKWLREKEVPHWRPFLVGVGEPVSKRVVFEGRWDNVVSAEKIRFTLELQTNVESTWIQHANWTMRMDPTHWAAFIEGGLSVHPDNAVPADDSEQPSTVLIKRLESTGQLPPGPWKDAPPSYLEYEDDRV